MSVLSDILDWSINRPMWQRAALRRLPVNGRIPQRDVEDLVENRARRLNPEGETEAELKKQPLTNLYSQRPAWLNLAHRQLNDAVLDAYTWPHDLTDEAILERLLALNLARAASEMEAP